MSNSATNNSEGIGGDLDFPVIAVTTSIALSIALAVIGVMGAAGALAGSEFGWIVTLGSLAIGALSLGTLAPAALITLILGILGLVGYLPFTTVGIGVALTMTIGLTCGCCITAHNAR